MFQEYIQRGVIVGIRVFDEPHDRDCSSYGYSNHVTISPEDLDEVYSYLIENFGEVPVGSTSPPCYIKRTSYGKLCFVQYRWPPSLTLQDFFSPHIQEARENDLFLIGSLNSNVSQVDNSTFFSAWETMCGVDFDFITSWQWPTNDRYPSPGVENRINDPAVQEILIRIKRSCNDLPQIISFNATPTSGEAPLEVSFTCEATDEDGFISEYKWDFDGDGQFDNTTSTGEITHIYQDAGTYHATCTVVDDEGAQASSEQVSITVSSPSESSDEQTSNDQTSEEHTSGTNTSQEEPEDSSSGGEDDGSVTVKVGGCSLQPGAACCLDLPLLLSVPLMYVFSRRSRRRTHG